MFTDLPAGGVTCGVAGAGGAAGIDTLGGAICGMPDIGAAGTAPGDGARFEGVEIMRVYSLGPCVVGVAGRFTVNACVAPPPVPYAFGDAGGGGGAGGAGSINPPVPNMRV
jgi:hypothetical protein